MVYEKLGHAPERTEPTKKSSSHKITDESVLFFL